MPEIHELEIVIIGAGRSKIGLWILGIIAKIFRINFEVRVVK